MNVIRDRVVGSDTHGHEHGLLVPNVSQKALGRCCLAKQLIAAAQDFLMRNVRSGLSLQGHLDDWRANSA